MQFLRERVDIRGIVRPMEPPEDVAALKLQPIQIGLIKEGPTLRWHDGQKIWDKRYHKDTQRVLKQRTKCEARAARLLKGAFDQGFVHDDANVNRQATEIGAARLGNGSADQQTEHDPELISPTPSRKLRKPSSLGAIQADRRWGPLDLYDERPPPTAIAGRRDTVRAKLLALDNLVQVAFSARGNRSLEKEHIPYCTSNSQNRAKNEGHRCCCSFFGSERRPQKATSTIRF